MNWFIHLFRFLFCSFYGPGNNRILLRLWTLQFACSGREIDYREHESVCRSSSLQKVSWGYRVQEIAPIQNLAYFICFLFCLLYESAKNLIVVQRYAVARSQNSPTPNPRRKPKTDSILPCIVFTYNGARKRSIIQFIDLLSHWLSLRVIRQFLDV